MFIVVLGGGIDLNGKLPPYVYKRLDEAIEIYKKFRQNHTPSMSSRPSETSGGYSPATREISFERDSCATAKAEGGTRSTIARNDKSRIVLTGRYSFLYKKQKPPLTESNKMAEYLLKKGIPRRAILRENFSRDTIGNAYYLKKLIFIPRDEKQAIIITSNFHIERARYIFKKIFGSDYDLKFVQVEDNLPTSAKNRIILKQKEILARTKKWLESMKDGDHSFLKGKLYKIKYYRNKREPWLMNFVAKGKI